MLVVGIQAGRLWFHQLVSVPAPASATDIETIAMASSFLEEIGIQGVKLHINALEIWEPCSLPSSLDRRYLTAQGDLV